MLASGEQKAQSNQGRHWTTIIEPCDSDYTVGLRKEHPSTPVSLCIGNYTADILPSRPDGQFWFLVVQPVHSREIVAIDRFDSYEGARDAAYDILAQMNGGPKLLPKP